MLGTARLVRLPRVLFFLSGALIAQNIETAKYPRYQAELEAFQKAFNGGARDRGEELATAGAAAARQAGDRSSEAHWIRLTGATFQVRGNIAKAREYYEKSLAIRRELDQRAEMIVLTTGIGIASLNLREYDASRRYLEEAVRLAAELKQPLDEGRAWQSLGLLEKVLQHYPKSIEAFSKAIQKYEEAGAPGKPFTGLMRAEIARVHIEQTQYPAALREAFAAVKILSELPRREAETAVALDTVGNAFHFMEDPPKALDYYRQALELRTKAKMPDLTESYRNIGIELDQTGSHLEAIENFEKVVAARRRGGAKTELAAALTNLAVAQQSAGRAAESRTNFTEALTLLPATRTANAQRAVALYGLGNLDIDENQTERALKHHREALRLRREAGDSLGTLRSLNRIGIALEGASQWKEALEVHREAGTAFESLLARIADPVQAVAFRATSAILYPHHARVLVELGQPVQALVTAERGRGTGLNRIGALQSAPDPAVAEAARRAASARNRLRLAWDGSRDRRLEEVAYLEAARELSRLRDASAAATQGSAVKAESAGVYEKILGMARSQPGTLFLEWVDVDDRLALLFSLSAKGGLQVHRLGSAASMGKTLDEWYAALSGGQNARGAKVAGDSAASTQMEPALARRAFQELFGGAAPKLDGFSRLVLVTDGPLLRTPFAALMDARGRRLIDRFSISTAISLTSLLTAVPPRRGSPRVYAIGDPIDSGSMASVMPQAVRFAPLVGAREEASAIARLLPGSSAKVGPEAREGEVKKSLPAFDIVHFATHGLLDWNDPLRSSLLLAAEPADSGEDGLLEAWEIASMRLNARMAALSACETGQGRETLSDGILGLSWAFQAAGCPDVVASLWSVDDIATRAMMIAFYANVRAGARIDDAMRTAMQKVRANKPHQAPYYWAAFQVIGPAGPVVAKR